MRDHFGFPSSDDNFSSAFDKSAGFASGGGAGFAGAGAGRRLWSALPVFSRPLRRGHGGRADRRLRRGSAGFRAARQGQTLKNFFRRRPFLGPGAQISRHARAGNGAAGFRRRLARLLHHVEKIAFEILRRIVHAHLVGGHVAGG